MEKWLKRIWFVNGILIFIGVSIFLWQHIRIYFPRHRPIIKQGPIVGKKLNKAIQDTLVLQDISMTLPRQIGSTQYRFIQLTAKDLTTPVRLVAYTELGSPQLARVEPYYSYEYNALEGSNTINLIFMKGDGSDAHLLLNKKGVIATADIPNERETVQKFNLYRIVFDDTDNDGRLTRSDRFDMYISDHSGKGLKQITDEKLKIIRYIKSTKENKIIFLSKVRPSDPKINEADWPEKNFIYNVKSSQLTPFFAYDSLLKSARNILITK